MPDRALSRLCELAERVAVAGRDAARARLSSPVGTRADRLGALDAERRFARLVCRFRRLGGAR